MNEKADHIAHLLQKRLIGELSVKEREELEKWNDEDPTNAAFAAHIQSDHWLRQAGQILYDYDGEKIVKKISAEFPLVAIAEPVGQVRIHRTHFLRTAWFKYAAAIIILIGIGAYLWNIQQQEKPRITTTKPVPLKNDVAPGSTTAILTLSDGRKVELTPETGTIEETGIKIENANGRLEYGKTDKVVFNTMTTPRGGQYQLTLPDGTNVWLNAVSSITYPTAFVSNKREVTITGEAYFEVKRNPSKPFAVKTPSDEITVLGTSFNVNAYSDEPSAKTSLLEGSVKIGDTFIKPGEAYQNGRVLKTNIEQDVAWKNGIFNFDNLPAEAALRQLARWYDVDIVYESKLPKKTLGGRMGRGLTLQQALKGLDGVIARFRLEGRKLHVSPM